MNVPTLLAKGTPEDAVIAAAQRGDLRAFGQLVQEYQELAYSVAYRILGNSEAAMDATQEAFLRGFQGLSRYRGGSFKAWILRITTNCSYDQLRYKQRRPSTSIDDILEDEEHSTLLMDTQEAPEEYAERQDLNRHIQRGLSQLPDDQRTVLVLSDIQGLTYSEIAQATSISVGTVKSRLSRARAKLRDHLLIRKELLPPGFRLQDDDTQT